MTHPLNVCVFAAAQVMDSTTLWSRLCLQKRRCLHAATHLNCQLPACISIYLAISYTNGPSTAPGRSRGCESKSFRMVRSGS